MKYKGNVWDKMVKWDWCFNVFKFVYVLIVGIVDSDWNVK